MLLYLNSFILQKLPTEKAIFWKLLLDKIGIWIKCDDNVSIQNQIQIFHFFNLK